MADSQDTSTPGKSPAFQFYPKDFLADAKTRAMTFKQRGMYWDLVCHCWLEGSLPADPKEIARILGIPTATRFATNDWPVIGKCFRLAEEGHQHPRLELERRKQAEHREERSDYGRRGAAKRWGSHTDGQPIAKPSPANSQAMSEPMAKNSSSSPISDLHLQTPVIRIRAGDLEAERAGEFIERYKALHVRLRKGAHYLGKPTFDFQEALQLVAVYDDARLDKLAYVWLNTDHEFATNGTRTIAKFRSMVSWCEERLIDWEEAHGPLTVAS